MNNNSGPIFIVGAPRSGTTLLQYMLRSHPEICVPTGESHFIIPLYRNEEKYHSFETLKDIKDALKDIYAKSRDFLETDLHGIKFDLENVAHILFEHKIKNTADFVETLFSVNAEGENKKRWGEKTPYYILHLDIILKLFPAAQIVHIIRDGRDCALSMLDRSKDLGIVSLYHAAQVWEQYVLAGQEFGGRCKNSQYYQFRYEDLVTNPKDEMSKLCEYLNIDFSDSVISYKKAKGSNLATPLLANPIRSDNLYKWHEQMTEKQIRLFESIAGYVLKMNSYELSTECKQLPIYKKAYYRTQKDILKFFSN